ncbi:prohead core scaffolding protein and protease [uncultured Caudovirales phage]|uniref:Prohead core scaffolding protein and protease n=1 Tax=uncultured Caudovirales phage TaxID=2100421 RepID=A0A6J7WYG7_9CAUD|nr:prohead core scaffolding protein and protease [uncultured Caudovirales phage]
MKLITEMTQDVKFLVEKKEDGSKSVYIEGIFMQAEKPNRNGRSYGKGIMEREVQRYQELINEKRSLGELGHPPNPQINLNQVSHLITGLKFEGNDIYGKAKILDTPMGKIAKNFIEEGVRLGVSSRGLGSVRLNKEGVNEVQDDFHLATVDIVADPSAPDAFVQGIMESADWILENGVWKAVQIEQAQNTIRKASKADLNSVKLDLFEQFLRSIK